MQVSYCPKDLPAEVAPSQEPQEGNLHTRKQAELIRKFALLEQPQQRAAEAEPARPVRKPLPVEGVSSESGHPPGIMPPEMPEKEVKPLPVGAPGNSDEVWSPWLGVCQVKFDFFNIFKSKNFKNSRKNANFFRATF